MATSGRRFGGRRLGVCLALAAAAALLTGAAALALGTGSGPARNYNGWCQARANAAWRRVLSRRLVPLSRTTSLVPLALAPNGRSFFGEVHSTRFTGVARIGTTARAMTEIKAFPQPNNDQADGTFDGRWFVWKEFRGFWNFDDFRVYAWDSRTGRVKRIGVAAKRPGGRFWESPWQGPEVRNGLAMWVQGSGPDGLAEIHVYDLRAGHGTVIQSGHAEGPFFLSHARVAWPASPTRGAEVRMYVASARTGRSLPTPRALRVLRGVSGLATDGRRIAFPSAQFKSLWWSPSLGEKPTEIVAARGADTVDNSVHIGGHYVSFGIQPHLFLADTDAHRYLELGHQYGYSLVNAAALVVDFGNNTKKRPDFRARIALVPLRDLPRIPGCR